MPETFREFLAFVATLGGLSAASSVVIGAAITALERLLGRFLTDDEKDVVGALTPFAVIGLVLAGQGALHYIVIDIDTIYQYIIVAASVAFGARWAYKAYRAIQRRAARAFGTRWGSKK